MKNFIAIFCFFIPALNVAGQCSVSVAASNVIPNPSTYLCSNTFGQTFTPTCTGLLKSVAFPAIYTYADDFRGSGYYVFCRIRNASGTLLATSAQTDQWYPGGTVTFDFSCANLSLTSGTVYQFELASNYTSCVYLMNYTTSSIYSGGNAIFDGIAYTAYDLRGWTVTLGNGAIAAASSSATQTLTASSCTVFYNSSNEAIAQVQSGSIAMGSTTAKAFVLGSAAMYNGQPYVRRYYDIAPATNASTATATTTLYYTQADFDNYNLNRGSYPALPTGPADAAGSANLRINQQHGTSASGAPGTFTGWAGSGPANVTITPSGVIYNSAVSRWEVTLPVTGFSGFFAYGSAGNPLPLRLISFTANADGNRNRIDWQTGVEDEGAAFTIERSADGIAFNTLSEVKGDGANGTYSAYDAAPMPGANYYRLHATDAGGQATYSNIVLVQREGYQGGITIAPVPAHNAVTITNSNTAINGQAATISDMQGKTMLRFAIQPAADIDLSTFPAGVYCLRLPSGQVIKIIKQ